MHSQGLWCPWTPVAWASFLGAVGEGCAGAIAAGGPDVVLSHQDGAGRKLPGTPFLRGSLKAQGSFRPQDPSGQGPIVLFFAKEKEWLSAGTSGDLEAIRSGQKLQEVQRVHNV